MRISFNDQKTNQRNFTGAVYGGLPKELEKYSNLIKSYGDTFLKSSNIDVFISEMKDQVTGNDCLLMVSKLQKPIRGLSAFSSQIETSEIKSFPDLIYYFNDVCEKSIDLFNHAKKGFFLKEL